MAQVALSLVLLVSAALLHRGSRALDAVPPGFRAQGALTFRVLLPEQGFASHAQAAAFHQALADRLRALPGVREVGVAHALPLSGFDGCSSVRAEGGGVACVPVTFTSGDYLAALGVPVAGRAPTRGEAEAGAPVAVVSQAFARHAWPGRDPIGRRLRLSERAEWHRVVGVAGDVRGAGLDRPAPRDVYVPLPSIAGGWPPPRAMSFVVRAPGADMDALAAEAARAAAAVDPRVPVVDARPLGALVAAYTAVLRFPARLLAVAAGAALLTSLLGLAAAARGLVPRAAGRPRLARAARLTAVGAGLGLLASVPASRVLATLPVRIDP
ncbi:MAG TPA: ABC transporter permease, partial [Longimicrobium sp.]